MKKSWSAPIAFVLLATLVVLGSASLSSCAKKPSKIVVASDATWPPMTAATGMDALTHAVEAYTNTLHYSDVDVQAIEAVRLIFSNLRAACAEGNKVEAREAMAK